MTEEDKELELLKAKRLREMQKNLSQRQRSEEPKEIPVTTSPREMVVKQLGYRGLEVLENAEAQFPEETRLVTAKLVELIQAGEITEIIDGGKLLTLFRSLGIRVRVQTTINVEQDGKLVSWSDKIKGVRNTESQETTTDENP
ncbi:MAG: double-stranded DNA-binding protein [Thaumarchaeota archaeon]|nr:MAG: double-stranded DNA-binding protein [Thaumarchaeota archaeon 13_1_40CM_4_38_7]OLC93598.1 MAG: double-stranded DNA-binding protein [Thaumarchaeota archaeon 13_1_40CM_3_38_6]TLY03303.1 MAG: double-stranded DNA-binding protein [Nitrososphaerota archaeon]